jgi:hypothetical protein
MINESATKLAAAMTNADLRLAPPGSERRIMIPSIANVAFPTDATS